MPRVTRPRLICSTLAAILPRGAGLRYPTEAAAAVDQHALAPGEHPLALRGQTQKPLTAPGDQNAQALFELPDAGGERRLGYVADRRRRREMPLAGQRGQMPEVANGHHRWFAPCSGFRSISGVPSRQSSPRTCKLVPSIAASSTIDEAIGLGRTGERSAKVPLACC